MDAPRYVPAMVKTMLAAPSNMVSHGIATVFNASDLSSLGRNGKNRDSAVQASKIMMSADEYLKRCGYIVTCSQKTKLLASLEVRCAMHVHSKI